MFLYEGFCRKHGWYVLHHFVTSDLNFSFFAQRNVIHFFFSELTAKKCVPCSSKDIWAMSEQSAKELLEKSELGVEIRNFGS